jgi:outer membrane receptor for ferrienterochelin and colicins
LISWLNVYVEKKWKNGIALRIGANNILNMRTSDVIFRGEDPFNYRANDNVSNPNGWQFDTTYIYAPNKGVHGFSQFYIP